MKRIKSVRVWSVLAKAVVLILLGAAAFDGTGRAIAQDDPPPPPDPIPADLPFQVPNTLYADGPGAIELEDVSPAEQEAILDVGERSDYGAAVHGAWSSAVTRPLAAQAEVQRAAHQSGTTGLDSVGVEP